MEEINEKKPPGLLNLKRILILSISHQYVVSTRLSLLMKSEIEMLLVLKTIMKLISFEIPHKYLKGTFSKTIRVNE